MSRIPGRFAVDVRAAPISGPRVYLTKRKSRQAPVVTARAPPSGLTVKGLAGLGDPRPIILRLPLGNGSTTGASADRPSNHVCQSRGLVKARVPQLVFVICTFIPGIALAQEAIVLKSFPGDSGPGPKDNPDNTGGVGPSHVVDCTDANIVIHDKKTGEVLRRTTQTEFWKNAAARFHPTDIERPPHDV